MKKYKLNTSLAWQEIRSHDLIYILNLDNGKFLYFNETGAFIIRMILINKTIKDIEKACIDNYDVSSNEINSYLNDFLVELERSKIIEVK